jgi:hypothetical protein
VHKIADGDRIPASSVLESACQPLLKELWAPLAKKVPMRLVVTSISICAFKLNDKTLRGKRITSIRPITFV